MPTPATNLPAFTRKKGFLGWPSESWHEQRGTNISPRKNWGDLTQGWVMDVAVGYALALYQSLRFAEDRKLIVKLLDAENRD